MSPRTLAILGLSAALLCAGAALADSDDLHETAIRVQAVNPLSTIEPAEWTTTGTVTQTITTGQYTYAEVSAANGDTLWLVTSGDPPAKNAQVEAQIFGTANNFHSQRTGKRFETLHFASVTPKNN